MKRPTGSDIAILASSSAFAGFLAAAAFATHQEPGSAWRVFVALSALNAFIAVVTLWFVLASLRYWRGHEGLRMIYTGGLR